MSEPCELIALPSRGRLELLADEGEVVFITQTGQVHRYHEHPLLREPGRLCWVLNSRVDAVLVGRRRSDRLHLFDLERCAFKAIPIGERLPRVEQLELVAVGSLFLALMESGIIALDRGGCELWRIAQTTYDWCFVGDAEGRLWFTDANGNLLAFDPATGGEVG